MSNGRRGMTAGCAAALAIVALGCGVGWMLAGDPVAATGADPSAASGADPAAGSVAATGASLAAGPVAASGADPVAGPVAAADARPLPGLAPGATPSAIGRTEMVGFADPRHAPVRVMRGPGNPTTSPGPAPGPAAGPAPMPITGRTEIVSFGTGHAGQVRVVRGMTPTAPDAASAGPALPTRVEKISFADPALRAVTVMRGIVPREAFAVGLFGPAKGGELDRIAFAVHGVESSHGTDPRMWRPELDGPQGPMQVSAAAALDVGGGDRFDLRQNRLLGRAYLAQMFRRYGNWPDALGAYNWGPGNLDLWIARGRREEKLPLETARYIERVLRDALIAGPAARL